MKFFAPILQLVIASLLLTLIIGAWRAYADFQTVKTKVKNVETLATEVRGVKSQLSTLTTKVSGLPKELDKKIDQTIDRRLADVPLCRRR
jgi:uncharacterized protein YoxC